MLTRHRVNFVNLSAQVSITGDSVRTVIHSWEANSGITAIHCRAVCRLEIKKWGASSLGRRGGMAVMDTEAFPLSAHGRVRCVLFLS